LGYCQLANFIFKSHRMHSIHRSMWSIATDFRRSAVCLSVSVFSWSMVTLMYCANKKLSYRIWTARHEVYIYPYPALLFLHTVRTDSIIINKPSCFNVVQLYFIHLYVFSCLHGKGQFLGLSSQLKSIGSLSCGVRSKRDHSVPNSGTTFDEAFRQNSLITCCKSD